MKLWSEQKKTDELIEKFTIGKDQDLDLLLAAYDVTGSIAHAEMLATVGLISVREKEDLVRELNQIHVMIHEGKFKLGASVEDVHSQVELILTEQLGDTGKKIHTGRSRNDQVMLDLRLFSRDQLNQVWETTGLLIEAMLNRAEKEQDVIMPGYTHLQVAMPSSFGLWFSAYAESLIDDLRFLKGIMEVVNRNPLGSGAGFGTNLPLDRELTTRLLGFDGLNINSVYAQMGRGKLEWMVATGLSSIASTLNKFSSDCVLFMNQHFGLIRLPENMTTGSSIMPHKKNPDVFEIMRGRTNLIRSSVLTLQSLTTNLPSGYFRDYQLLKESYLPLFSNLAECLQISELAVVTMEVHDVTTDPAFDHLFTVEKVNELVKQGTPFRDAYKQVGEEVRSGKFTRPRTPEYTHLGSIGNPGIGELRKEFRELKGMDGG